MVNQVILDYLKKYANSYPLSSLREKIISSGYSVLEVDEAIGSLSLKDSKYPELGKDSGFVNSGPFGNPGEKTVEMPFRKGIDFKWMMVSSIIGFILTGIFLISYVLGFFKINAFSYLSGQQVLGIIFSGIFLFLLFFFYFGFVRLGKFSGSKFISVISWIIIGTMILMVIFSIALIIIKPVFNPSSGDISNAEIFGSVVVSGSAVNYHGGFGEEVVGGAGEGAVYTNNDSVFVNVSQTNNGSNDTLVASSGTITGNVVNSVVMGDAVLDGAVGGYINFADYGGVVEGILGVYFSFVGKFFLGNFLIMALIVFGMILGVSLFLFSVGLTNIHERVRFSLLTGLLGVVLRSLLICVYVVFFLFLFVYPERLASFLFFIGQSFLRVSSSSNVLTGSIDYSYNFTLIYWLVYSMVGLWGLCLMFFESLVLMFGSRKYES